MEKFYIGHDSQVNFQETLLDKRDTLQNEF